MSPAFVPESSWIKGYVLEYFLGIFRRKVFQSDPITDVWGARAYSLGSFDDSKDRLIFYSQSLRVNFGRFVTKTRPIEAVLTAYSEAGSKAQEAGSSLW